MVVPRKGARDIARNRLGDFQNQSGQKLKKNSKVLPPCISVSGENVKCLNKYAGLGLLSTGGLNSRSSSIV